MERDYNEFGDEGTWIDKAYAEWFRVEWAKVTSELKSKLANKDIILVCEK